jgi:hypothetical protein
MKNRMKGISLGKRKTPMLTSDYFLIILLSYIIFEEDNMVRFPFWQRLESPLLIFNWHPHPKKLTYLLIYDNIILSRSGGIGRHAAFRMRFQVF